MPYTRTTWQDFPNTTTPIDAARLNNIEAFLDGHASLNDAWTSYTPTWTGTGGTPSIGNGTLAGRYIRTGKTVSLSIALVIGSTTNLATATAWSFSLPAQVANVNTQLLSSRVFDSDVTTTYVGVSGLAANATTTAPRVHGGTQVVGYLVPMTWATGDILTLFGTYEAA
jgi:hypothetical protein